MGSPLSKPTRIGAYDIVDVIGRGGMGTVFKGLDPRIGRSVAIKVLSAAADDPDLLLRFYREAKYTGSLQHQNIVTVYELGHQDGVPYLVMEYLEGVSLDAIIASGRPMPMGEKLRIILQVCSGLSYAHKRDLVHRDIKPANIVILDNGTAKIVDFGIARLGGNRLTRTGHVVGSLNYMSPEQLGGNVEVDLRTDVYSTGVVLFQLVTGVLPFDGGTTAATLTKIIQEPPPPLARYLKDCPADLETITQKALAKKPDDRYPSADELAIDIARLQQQYESQMLAEYLHRASDSLRRKDFPSARHQVLKVLRVAPQNGEASEMLKLVKQGQEQQQREVEQQRRDQQALQLQMKAEESFRKSEFVVALQFVEQGLQIDPGRTAFLGLRDAIFDAQTKMARYREALQDAETAMRSGDFETAKHCIDSAIESLPDDPECRALASRIASQIDEHLREQRAAEAQKQIAVATNTVEKAMADARMLIFLGRGPEALRALESVESELSLIPESYREQVEAHKQEARAKIEEEQRRPAPTAWDEPPKRQTGEIAVPNATVLMQSSAPAPEAEIRDEVRYGEVRDEIRYEDTPFQQFAQPTVEYPLQEPTQEFERPPIQDDGHFQYGAPLLTDPPTGQYSIQRPQHVAPAEKSAIAPEMMEFLQPEPKIWSRPGIWVGVAIAILLAACVWLTVRPKPQRASNPQTSTGGSTAVTSNYTYAEINAEPWGTITGIEPADGDAQKVIGTQTPLRLKLPPGQYSVTLEGPNHEQKQVDVTVPEQGGTSCFVFFRKPDLNQILGKK
jgi:serine/threonine protein kinase